MKKVLKSLLVIALLIIQLLPTLSVNAASGKYDNSGKITITNAEVGQKYSLYQILKLESYDTEREAYTYKVDTTSAWYSFLTEGEGKNYVNVSESTNIVTWKNGADVKEFSSKAQIYAETNSIAALQEVTATSATVEFDGLYLGYYLVDSSLGLLCTITTTNPTINVEEKNGAPTISKKVKETSTGDFLTSNKEEIGKIVYFQTTINAENGAQDYKLYDKMSAGLTLNKSSITVTLKQTGSADKTLKEGTDYTLTTTDQTYTFIIDFSKELEKTLTRGNEIIVDYSAVLNANAIVGGTGNSNETYLTYGENSKTTVSETRTYTFSFDLIKTDNKGEQLSGAEFELYDAKNGGNKINLIDLGNNTYRVVTEEETKTQNFQSAKISAGAATIKGLDADKSYYLEEVTAPNGYNKLTSRVEVKLTATIANNESSVVTSGAQSNTVVYAKDSVAIINLTDNLLPSTGGIGTTIFVTVGLSLVLGFGLLLVTKLRIQKTEN